MPMSRLLSWNRERWETPMQQGLALYAALKIEQQQREQGEARSRRCCTDEPPEWALRGARRERPFAVARWTRKLGAALPATSAFRGTFSQPVGPRTPAVGNRVITPQGETVGRVLEPMVGLKTGQTTYAVASAGEDRGRVLVLPPHALRPGAREDVFILDPGPPEPQTRTPNAA
jgi:hypothetical protein